MLPNDDEMSASFKRLVADMEAMNLGPEESIKIVLGTYSAQIDQQKAKADTLAGLIIGLSKDFMRRWPDDPLRVFLLLTSAISKTAPDKTQVAYVLAALVMQVQDIDLPVNERVEAIMKDPEAWLKSRR